ncbi:MAG TPA: right-handed parallel beta-helix repeat-containing protein, partial [Flavisolibacter sp.]|nr:right-handed parallel beta-helix repeat-containing protein [Flavisolibacter sp.]
MPVGNFPQATPFIYFKNIANLTITALNIEGNGAIATPVLNTSDNGMFGISAESCTNVLIQNCNLTRQPKAGIFLENCTNSRILNNNIPECCNYSIWVNNGVKTQIKGNTVSGQGIAQHAATTLGQTPGIMVTKVNSVVVEKNNIDDFKNTGTKCEGCLYVTYDTNIVRNIGKDAIKIQPFLEIPTRFPKIVNNTVEYLRPWATDGSSCIELNDCKDIVIQTEPVVAIITFKGGIQMGV